jgi:hypothetical protein
MGVVAVRFGNRVPRVKRMVGILPLGAADALQEFVFSG